MNDKKECTIFNMNGIVYIIPSELSEEFDLTPYDARKGKFDNYILPDEGVIEEVLLNISDYENLLEGYF